MYKLIRTIAPVVLVLFFCGLFAGPCWGGEMAKAQDNPDVTYSIQFKDGQPQINKEFEIIVKAHYRGAPLFHLKPTNYGAFEVINLYSEQDATFSQKIKAPSKQGTYICSFEGTTPDGSVLSFGIPIKVYSEKASSPNIGFIACVVTGAVLCGGMGYAIGQLGDEAWMMGLLGAVGGALGGAIIGALLFPESKEDNK